MQTLVEVGCGLDVHQATVVACLLRVRRDWRVDKQLRTFGTTTRELVQLRSWLMAEGCIHVAMESTGVYWKPVYAVLEGDELGFKYRLFSDRCSAAPSFGFRERYQYRRGARSFSMLGSGIRELSRERYLGGF